MRLNNKVYTNATDCATRSEDCSLRVIRFWSVNAVCSAQCGTLDSPEDQLTECRIIEVLLYIRPHLSTSEFYDGTSTFICIIYANQALSLANDPHHNNR